jgi:hypothetical protein
LAPETIMPAMTPGIQTSPRDFSISSLGRRLA